jgi:hypothetical protein
VIDASTTSRRFIAAANARLPYTTKCSPNRITFAGTDARIFFAMFYIFYLECFEAKLIN